MEIKLEEVRKRYEMITSRLRGQTKGPIGDEERELVKKYAGVDLHGWLLSEVDRLTAFAAKAHAHSTCPGTVLVAGQVVNGWDVRTVANAFSPLAAVPEPEHGQPPR